MASSRPVVAVLLLGLDVSQWAVVEGLRAYRDRHRLDWDLRVVDPASAASVPPGAWWVLRTPGLLRHLPADGPRLPVCVLLGEDGARHRACCRFDEHAFGLMAARHVDECGYRHAATVDLRPRRRFGRRRQGFADGCRRAGIAYHHYVRPRDRDRGAADARLHRWIAGLPRPLAFYAVVDEQAAWLRDVLVDGNWDVPGDVGLVGTGDHTTTCLRREPELTSVAFPWNAMGEAAAAHCHQQMQGAIPPPRAVRASHVTVRGSTADLVPTDRLVRDGLAWLARHPAEPRPVAGLARHLRVAEATCYRRFVRALGAGPKAVHERLRLREAEHLLARSRAAVAEVGRRCGYRSATSFGIAFKRRHGCSPGAWRRSLPPRPH